MMHSMQHMSHFHTEIHLSDTVSVCRTVSEIFSIKEWHDLKTRSRGRSRSQLQNVSILYNI